jgi:hypothetical protein
MAIEFSRYQCRACGKPVLHVRNRYDVPHLGHLIFICGLAMASLVARDVALATLFSVGVVGWLLLWAVHAVVNRLLAGPPFRCQVCGCEPGESQKAI